MNKKLLLISVGVVGVVLDQASKAWARHSLGAHSMYLGSTKIGFSLTSNSGSAFSLFQSSTIYLTIISIVVIVVLIIAAVRTSNKLLALAYVMIATGAIGNVIDRFTQTPYGGHGHVTDFIRIYSWPTFNIADSLVTTGSILLIIVTLFVSDEKSKKVAIHE